MHRHGSHDNPIFVPAFGTRRGRTPIRKGYRPEYHKAMSKMRDRIAFAQDKEKGAKSAMKKIRRNLIYRQSVDRLSP